MANIIEIPAIRIAQNENDFFVFKMRACDLLAISFFRPREIDRESGIQRPFKAERSREIAEYVDSDNSVLPNNIIVNINPPAFKGFENGILAIERMTDATFVIDGQHRLKAFQYAAKKDFELPVSAFVGLSWAFIAEIFVKINYYQKPVNKSLVYDLLGISPDIFPDYFEAHEVTKVLNETIGSPFFRLIKMLGIGEGIITQATFISALEKNKILNKILLPYDKKDKIVIVSNYFSAIKEIFPNQWGHRGSIVSKSVGFHALTRMFPRVFETLVENTGSFKTSQIIDYMKDIKNIALDEEPIASLGGQKGVKTLAELMEKRLPKGIKS